jgi:hypothetical protein
MAMVLISATPYKRVVKSGSSKIGKIAKYFGNSVDFFGDPGLITGDAARTRCNISCWLTI